MTNFDKWKERITELNGDVAVVRGIPSPCTDTSCSQCDFNSDNCTPDAWRWLCKEYEVPKPKIKPKSKRIIDVDKFIAYLESEIKELEADENHSADKRNYTSAFRWNAYASAFRELLGLITLDNPPAWVRIEEAKND